MGKRTKPTPRLGFWWVVRRELEIQARPSERHEYSYRGLWRPLSLVLLLLLAGIWDLSRCSCQSSSHEPVVSALQASSCVVVLCLYALYRAHAAACLGAGSLRDMVALRHAGVSPGAVLAGKLAASLLPLWVEFAWMAPLIGVVLRSVGCSLQALGFILALLALQTVGFGLLGMGFAAEAPARRGSVVGVRGFLFSLFYLPPVVLFLAISRPGMLVPWAPFGDSWVSGFGPEGLIPQVAGLLMTLPNPVVQVLMVFALDWYPRASFAPGNFGFSCVLGALGLATLLILGFRRFREVSRELQ